MRVFSQGSIRCTTRLQQATTYLKIFSNCTYQVRKNKKREDAHIDPHATNNRIWIWGRVKIERNRRCSGTTGSSNAKNGSFPRGRRETISIYGANSKAWSFDSTIVLYVICNNTPVLRVQVMFWRASCFVLRKIPLRDQTIVAEHIFGSGRQNYRFWR